MHLNDAGIMVKDVCKSMYGHNNDAQIDDIVVMPNHIHCIITIINSGNISLPDIMRYIKSKTTVEYIHGVREKGWKSFDKKLWQQRYYDHLIRTQRTYDMLRNYIYQNPKRWNKDCLNPQCDIDANDIETMINEDERYICI